MRFFRFWRDIPIFRKMMIILGTLMGLMWIIVIFNVIQLSTLANKSTGIMQQYNEITGFINAITREDSCLEAYVRPSHTLEDENAYLDSVRATDASLAALQPSLKSDRRQEYMLKRAITNAMVHYRQDQAALVESQDYYERIRLYVLLQRQNVYLNRYGLELLQFRMREGERSWESITVSNRGNTRVIMGLMVAATCVTVFCLYLLIQTMLRPLQALGAAADAISGGDYDSPPLNDASADEIGRMAHSFNIMQSRVKQTIRAMEREAEIEKENARMQEAMQESRYAELQSQIDPHFLFNTLNAIAAMANEEDAPITENLIERMAKIFRYSLESHEKRVTLGQELQYLADYMELMDARFAGRISMDIQPFDPALNDRAVPKFMLQTIAENSIIHGFQDITVGGEIDVRIFEDDRGRLVIEMADNGCGFDVSTLEEPGEHRSVGLNNIRERLQYLGGRMDIESVIGQGTRITMTIDRGERND